ncbi:MAG: aminoacyl-tRNA hydrolase [Patescibacteria group bacterium]|nr:aminoacyl-tRNA hydrolase [Patescibacteria group bacterium]
MKLIIGLGNKGTKYGGTRHNVGFQVVNMLREELDFPEFHEKTKFKAMISEGEVEGEKVVLVKPLTYMNLSGEAVLAVKYFYKASNEDILVVFDDYDLPLGDVRYRYQGGAGTHNGMKSCISVLGENFPRLKIGINAGLPVMDLSGYVLGRFTEEETSKIAVALGGAILEIKKILAISGESE